MTALLRIEAVELTQIELPLRAPFSTSFGTIDRRQFVLVKVLADGVYGWGEVSALNDPLYNYETPVTAWHILTDYLVPAVLGRTIKDPAEVPGLFAAVRGHHFAKAGLESAIWDAFARARGVPLKVLLGGEREKIPVGVSLGIQPSPADLVRVVDSFAQAGYQRMKIKIKPGRDVGDLQAVRQAFPELPIMADANSAYTLADTEIFRRLDDLNLMMYEQPLAHDDIIDHVKLQAAVRTPICLDESIHSPEDARKALELGACRIINIKLGRVSGHTWAKQVHDVARSRGVPVWCGGMMESGVGRAHNIHMATLPGFSIPGDTSASDRYYVEDVVDEPAALNPDGTLTVPTRPGIGVEVVADALRRRTQRATSIRCG